MPPLLIQSGTLHKSAPSPTLQQPGDPQGLPQTCPHCSTVLQSCASDCWIMRKAGRTVGESAQQDTISDASPAHRTHVLPSRPCSNKGTLEVCHKPVRTVRQSCDHVCKRLLDHAEGGPHDRGVRPARHHQRPQHVWHLLWDRGSLLL